MKDTPAKGIEARDIPDADRLKNPERLKALARTGVIGGPWSGAHQRAARIAARLLDVPVSLVSFVDDERQYFSAEIGLSDQQAADGGSALSHSFCQHVVTSEAPLVVRDARADAFLCDNGAVRDMAVVAYLGVPIRSPDGHVLGSLCAIDRKPRDWTDDDVDHLRDVADMIESDLLLREALDERDIVLQEMSHRVKNLFTVINSILRMERRAHDTSEELAESLGSRLRALSDAHEMIVPVVSASRSIGTTTTLDALTRKILAPHGAADEVRISIRGENVPVGPKAAVYLTLALHELATNAAKYGGLSADAGRLSTSWETTGSDVVIRWEEEGRAWDTEPAQQAGFGSRLLSIAVENQLAGNISTMIDADRFLRCLTIPQSSLQT